MKKALGYLVYAFSCVQLMVYAQGTDIAKITVDAGRYDRKDVVVGINLDGIGLDLTNNELVLFEINERHETEISSQLDMHHGPILWWKIQNKLTSGKSRTYLLRKKTKSERETASIYETSVEGGNLIIRSNGKNVLKYNFKAPALPDSVPPIYTRAGFIHPLWSPKGEILTRIQPPDHYHHVGIWNPWTHTKYKGKEIDFWNLAKAEGTVKPSSIVSITSNSLFAGFRVVHDHIDLNGQTPNGYEVALKEEWNIRVWNVFDNAWVIDFVSTLNCATDSALEITKYRYQGFGFRATKNWDDATAKLITSEGKSKEDGNATRARWCNVYGISAFGTSGVLFITHSSNYNYPEPIRIWPVGANNGKENVFFNFNPAMDRDWILEPGKEYRLKYRMYVYDGEIDLSTAEKLWQDFAFPPKTSLEIISKN